MGHRNYALFWIGFATTRFGRSVEETGAVWLMYELTGSPVLLGFLGLSRALPAIALGPIAGVVADRVDQRRLLFMTQALGLAVSFGLGVLVVTGLVEFWHLYVQLAIQATIESFDATARQALFPRLVPRAQLAEAVTLSATAGRTSKLVGPPIGGLAIAVWGEGSPFLLNAATFPVLMVAVSLMVGVVPRGIALGSSFRGELSEGLRHIFHEPVLAGLLKLEIVIGLLQVNPVMITIIGRETLGVGPQELGVLLAAPAVGALIGIVCVVAFGQTMRQGRFAILCAFAYSGTLVGLAVSRDFTASLAALIAIGIADVLVTVTRLSVMQLATPGRMRGRVMGNMGTITRGVSPLAETQSGLLAAAIGPSPAVVTAATALVIAAAWIARANPALWDFSRADPLTNASRSSSAQSPPNVR